jgi:hypothetical protein
MRQDKRSYSALASQKREVVSTNLESSGETSKNT